MMLVVVPPQQPTSSTTSCAVTCFSAARRYSTTFHVTTVGESPRPSRACSAGSDVRPMLKKYSREPRLGALTRIE